MRGKSPENTTYLWSNKEKKGCCLGHAIHQIERCPWKNLNLLSSPKQYFNKESFLTERHGVGCSDNLLADEAMIINDSACTDDDEKEKQLISLFRAHGLDLKFYN